MLFIPLKIIRRLTAPFTPFYMQNVMHAFSSVETSPDTRKTQSFADIDENQMLFIPLKIIRRLTALFTPFYMQNVSHAFSSVQTSPDKRKSQSFADFDEN